MDDASWELDEHSLQYDQETCRLWLRKLLREQEELSLEMIHLNNKRRFELAGMCIETTILIAVSLFAIGYSQVDGGVLQPLSNFMLGCFFAVVVCILAHSIYCWYRVVKDEKKRQAGIEKLKRLEKEIERLQNIVVLYKEPT